MISCNSCAVWEMLSDILLMMGGDSSARCLMMVYYLLMMGFETSAGWVMFVDIC